MARALYLIIDTLVLLACLPGYAVLVPAMLLHEQMRQRRSVRLGLEVTHWVAPDIHEDYLVVDVSRVGERVVGVRRRSWNVYRTRGSPPPAYSDAIEYIPVKRFWVPRPLSEGLFRRTQREAPDSPAGS